MTLTSSQRIVFNALATYGRTLFGIAFSLFSSRWVLNGLGLSDFGLVGVVGALLVFVSIFNTILGGSIGRFYSYVIGKHHIEPCDACEELTRWFNTALCVHTIVPLVLTLIGYPIGVYCIDHYLAIPSERLSACHLVFVFSLVTTFVNMVSIPYTSFYSAWQRFGEYVLWETLRNVLMFVCAYTLLQYKGDRLIYYAFYSCVVMSVVTIVQMIRSARQFKPCQFRASCWFDRSQLRDLLSFSGWQLFGSMGGLLRGQGVAIVINLFYGPKINGSYNVANQLSGQASSLSAAMVTALTPAVTSAEGGGDTERVRHLAFQTCKFGTMLLALFAVPLALEVGEVLEIWLKQHPPFAAPLCILVVATALVDKITTGYMPAIMARGRIALYQVVTGSFFIATIPVAFVFARMGLSPVSIGWAFLLTTLGSSVSRLYFGQQLVGLSPFLWAREVLGPLMVSLVISIIFGAVPRMFIQQSIGRLLLVCACCAISALVADWLVVLSSSERKWIVENVVRKMSVSLGRWGL